MIMEIETDKRQVLTIPETAVKKTKMVHTFMLLKRMH